MKYLSIEQTLFIQNRQKFCRKLKAASLAVFFSNDIFPTNADGVFPFRQNNDLFYLSGIDQEESILLLFPDCPEPRYREILFIRETNEHISVWEGEKLTKEQAQKVSGIETIFWTSDFETILNSIIFEAKVIYLNANEHTRASNPVVTREERYLQWFREQFPLHNFERAAPIIHNLRAIKSSAELDLIKEAIRITENSFRRLLNFVKPGVMEFEIEAELWHEFLKSRSRGPAYAPIIASGKNACILHYVDNDKQCKDGNLLLLDIGAEYANYNADLTRTIPVNGRYSPRQRDVYNAVLRVMKQAKAMLVPGNDLQTYNKEVGKLMEKELVDLNLLSLDDIKKQNPNVPAYKRYFMHGTSHYLGLDVHDVGSRYRKFEPGMVFTCEPGIYIREEGIGVRIENDILITEDGPLDLMATIPVETEEIEDLMNLRKM